MKTNEIIVHGYNKFTSLVTQEKLANVIPKFDTINFRIDNVLNGFLFYISLEKLS